MAAKLSLRLTRHLPRLFLQSRAILAARWCQSTAKQVQEPQTKEEHGESTFDELLNSSKLFASHPVGCKVVAEIIAERDEHLYVDFGGKFHAVVPRPVKNGHLYAKGKWVDVIVEDLEVTSHFLGNNKDTSLLEAHVKMTGLSHYKPQLVSDTNT